MKTVFILNAQVDFNQQYRWMQEVKKYFKRENIIIEKTKGIGHAVHIAEKYAQMKEPIHIYICGGDGTIHEVINGAIGNSNLYFSILPMGTGNDFIKSFLPLTKEDFLDLSNYKKPILKNIDILKINNEYAINTISFGFDVTVAKYANQMKKGMPMKGRFPYYLGMLAALRKSYEKEYDIQVDDVRLNPETYMFVVLCNGKYYGGGYQPCPYALYDDGMIDMCLIKPISALTVVQFANAYQRGEHVFVHDLVSLHQGKKITFNTGNDSLLANLDGEVRRFSNPTVEIIPQAVHLLLPNIGE